MRFFVFGLMLHSMTLNLVLHVYLSESHGDMISDITRTVYLYFLYMISMGQENAVNDNSTENN